MDPSEIDPNAIHLSEIEQPGIYNKAIVVLVPKSKYTQGLESELTSISKLDIKDVKGTALGGWLNGNDASNEKELPGFPTCNLYNGIKFSTSNSIAAF